jgi:hypothetical protein
MSNKYFNFSLSGIGGSGIDVDPYHIENFPMSITNGDVCHCRGSGVGGSSLGAFPSCTIVPWDLALYGHWSYFNTASLSGYGGFSPVSMTGGVFEAFAISDIWGELTLNNMYFRTTWGGAGFSNINILNSTLITGTKYDNIIGNINIVNSVVLFQNPSDSLFSIADDASTNSIINSVTSCDYLSDIIGSPNELFYVGTHSGSVSQSAAIYSATIPTLPAYNDPVAKFNLFPGYGVSASGSWAEPAAQTQTLANIIVMAQELQQAQNFVDQQTDFYTIMELSSMSMTTARDFIKETNKQNITSSNSWRDNSTGRIVLFEKQGQANRLM